MTAPDKTEPIFLESVKAKDGVYFNLELHEKRIYRSFGSLGRKPDFSLSKILPEPPSRGLFKARVLYPADPPRTTIEPYGFPRLDSLALMEDDGMEYPLKFLDRSRIRRLKESCPASDFILCVKGFVTDSSIANLVFENGDGLFTPATFLLPGTKREFLLRRGVAREAEIRKEDLKNYSKAYFINAMIDIEDDVSVPLRPPFFRENGKGAAS
ncbi:MAG: aminotransferase class IV [Deltaproteobacteria bacterium]|jgi:4-amino-4-deoxychorismate lyase|nr:aminotransferase class IV [Deltaproteobacteria bacterium]